MNQFKFGDRVKHLGLKHEFIVIRSGGAYCEVVDKKIKRNIFLRRELVLIPPPDTERLDFVEKIINIDGMVKREIGKGWVLFAEYDLSEPKPLLRDAIDAAMQAEAKAT